MITKEQRRERCETCRFWEPVAGECRRRAPAVFPPLAVRSRPSAGDTPAEGAWPRTRPDHWCGEWVTLAEHPVPAEATVPGREVAVMFLARIAPTLHVPDPTALLESLLNQLPPAVRRVVVRMHGLDGQPRCGLKDVAREFKMSRGHARDLLDDGERRLAEFGRRLAQDGTRAGPNGLAPD